MTPQQRSLLDRLSDESQNSKTVNALLQIIRQQERGDQVLWTEFTRGTVSLDFESPGMQASIRQAMETFKMTRQDVVAQFRMAAEDTIMLNSRYQVNMRKYQPPSVLAGIEPTIVHLSIKRLDKGTVIPWRDKQRIKNELVGPEYEAVELYPAEDRLVDTANQYHLWCIYDPTYRFPFGFKDRFVTENTLGNSVQAPFEK